MENDISVVIVGYQRTKNILKLIEDCIQFKIKRIYLYLDGTLNSRGRLIQDQLFAAINQSKFKNDVTIYRSKENRGSAISVLSAIRWISSHEEEFIILEDDLVISKQFINYANLNLKKYKNNQSVLMVSGNNFTTTTNLTHSYFINIPQNWGWATWASKWLEFEQELFNEPSFNFPCGSTLGFLTAGCKRSLRGKIDAWDTVVAYRMYVKNLFCIIPPSNLVSNIGDDEFAQHSNSADNQINFPIFEISPILENSSQVELNKEVQDFIFKKIYRIKLLHLFFPIYLPIENKLSKKAKFKLELFERFAESVNQIENLRA